MRTSGIESADASPSARREGRGWLSTIDLLPDECEEDIAWANAELRERKTPQNEIWREFNARLADKNIKGVSRSAFNRHSLRLALATRKMDASHAIAEVVLKRLGPGERSDSVIAASEMLKFRILEMVMSEEEPDPKLLGAATLALRRLAATVQHEDEVRQRKLEQEQREADKAEQEQAASEVAEAATRIATEAGLSAERIAAIRRGVLGLAT